MISIVLLIPLTDNNGQPFTANEIAVWEVYLTHHFGGFTRIPGTGRGGWVNESGKAQIEDHRQYAVGIKNGAFGDNAKVMEAVSFAKQHFGQDAIGVSYLGIFEIL